MINDYNFVVVVVAFLFIFSVVECDPDNRNCTGIAALTSTQMYLPLNFK